MTLVRTLARSLALSALLLCATPLELDAADEPAPLFASLTPLEVVLTLPMRQLRAQKRQREKLYLEGQWTFRDGGELVRLSLKARARGKSRLETCFYPPIRLNFLKKQVKGTLFDGQDKLKLVNPCRRSDDFEQLVMLEYLAYRLLLAVTDEAFLVRPLEIHFVDSEGKDKARTGFGFVIEDEDAMAKRIGGKVVKSDQVDASRMDQEAMALAELFQYLVGNNDYSLVKALPGEECCHNARPVLASESGRMVSVPYDFDMSGLVEAPYAAPPQALPIRSVRQRYFTGICKEEGVWRRAIERFVERRDALYAEVAALPKLDGKSRQRTIEYMDDFFATITDDSRLAEQILSRCRG